MIDRPRILLGYYEAIGRVSHVMLGAATRGDWKAFEQAHACCSELIACLEASGISPEALDGQGRRRRMEILRQVLADDARIRDIAHPSMRRLDALLAGRRLAALEESLAP